MREKYMIYVIEKNNPAWMIEHEGRRVCAFGAIILWQGVCELWFNLISYENTLSILRILRRSIKENAQKYHIKRMQAAVNVDSAIENRFVSFFDFQLEGILRSYEPNGNDAYMYSRIF